MSDGSKKLRRQLLKQIKAKTPSPLKVRRLLQKHNPVLLQVLIQVCNLHNPRSRKQLLDTSAQAILGKKTKQADSDLLKKLLEQAATQNPLIDLKRPYKSKPCGGCPARHGGICRCAQKALRHAA